MLSRRSSIADSAAFAGALVIAFGVLYAILARVALDAFPYSGDEYSLALQAELLAHGQLKAPAPIHAEWLRIDHVVIDQFVRSKYPVGCPALLSLGARLGAMWIVNPLIGAVALAVVWWTARRLLGPRPGLVALVALGAAPLFAIDAASHYAHISTLLMLALGFAAVTLWVESERDGWLVATGFAIGAAFLIRQLDAVLFGVALLVFRSRRAVVIPGLVAVPFVVATLWYHDYQFGSPLTDGYRAYEPTFTALYGQEAAMNPISWRHIISPTQWWNHLDLIGQLCTQWTLPGTVVVALFGSYAPLANDRAAIVRRFCFALIAVFLIALVPMIGDLDDGPRPRYLTVVLIPLAVLCAAGLSSLSRAIVGTFGSRIRTAIVTLGVVFGLAQLGAFLQDRIPKIWKREGLFEVTASLPRDAVVIVRAQYPSRFARNGPFFDGILYLSTPPTTSALEVAAAYPDRPIWEAREGVPWTLQQVHEPGRHSSPGTARTVPLSWSWMAHQVQPRLGTPGEIR